MFLCQLGTNIYFLDQELLQGPYLSNQLVLVLSSLREEPTAVMCDKAIFCQVRLPDHCDYLSFLWWLNGNLDCELEEYLMNIHYFDITSSLSCVNYTLRRAATENTK